VSYRAVETVELLLGTKHEALGSVEGRLSTVSERKGFRFAVYDVIHDEPVLCILESKLLHDDAIRAFGRRVLVGGRVRYNKEGRPTSVVVNAIRVFKEEDELPRLEQVQAAYHA